MSILKNHSCFGQSIDIRRFGDCIADSTFLRILDSGVHSLRANIDLWNKLFFPYFFRNYLSKKFKNPLDAANWWKTNFKMKRKTSQKYFKADHIKIIKFFYPNAPIVGLKSSATIKRTFFGFSCFSSKKASIFTKIKIITYISINLGQSMLLVSVWQVAAK